MTQASAQAVLGIFVGIFAYCLVVLVGIVLALLGVAVPIFLLHHTPIALQASETNARIARETCATVDRLYPQESDDTGPEARAADGTVRVLGRQLRVLRRQLQLLGPGSALATGPGHPTADPDGPWP